MESGKNKDLQTMKRFFAIYLLLLLSSCSGTTGEMQSWRVRDLVQGPGSTIVLQNRNRKAKTIISKQNIQKMLLAHLQLLRVAGTHAELVLVEGTDPNAFVGRIKDRTILAVNLAMIELIGGNIDEFAFLLGHEIGHLAEGHLESSQTRSKTIQTVGSLVGMGLGIAGVPAGSSIAGVAVNLINATFSRDQERVADALGVGYVQAVGYNPRGALRLQEKIMQGSKKALIPFLSSHPSGGERIKHLNILIEKERPSQIKR